MANAFADQMRKVTVAQLLATRDTLLASVTQIDAALLALGVDVDALDDAAPQPNNCPHPPSEIVNHHTTLDDDPDDFECHLCGARQPEPFHPD